MELFHKKVTELFSNQLRLKRIFSKYEIFDLPYDITQKTQIEGLFDEMVGISESRKKKNIAMKALLEVLARPSLEDFRAMIDEGM